MSILKSGYAARRAERHSTMNCGLRSNEWLLMAQGRSAGGALILQELDEELTCR
jgi:hypothetical protein